MIVYSMVVDDVLADNTAVDHVAEYTVVVETLLAKDAVALVSAAAPLVGDGEWAYLTTGNCVITRRGILTTMGQALQLEGSTTTARHS